MQGFSDTMADVLGLEPPAAPSSTDGSGSSAHVLDAGFFKAKKLGIAAGCLLVECAIAIISSRALPARPPPPPGARRPPPPTAPRVGLRAAGAERG
eukprot:SAG11_NODE_14457_length_611_cov_1.101562_1_plen_95_part_10